MNAVKIFRSLAVLIVLLPVAACATTSTRVAEEQKPPRVDYKAYYGCINSEAETTVKGEIERGVSLAELDPKSIGDRTYETCTSRFFSNSSSPRSEMDRRSAELMATDVLTALMRADVEKKLSDRRKQAELDAPKLEAESRAAMDRYGDCVAAHAKVLALASSESAEVVSKVAFAACRDERRAILEVHHHYNHFIDDDFMDKVENKLTPELILEIMKMRATRPSPPREAKPDQGI